MFTISSHRKQRKNIYLCTLPCLVVALIRSLKTSFDWLVFFYYIYSIVVCIGCSGFQDLLIVTDLQVQKMNLISVLISCSSLLVFIMSGPWYMLALAIWHHFSLGALPDTGTLSQVSLLLQHVENLLHNTWQPYPGSIGQIATGCGFSSKLEPFEHCSQHGSRLPPTSSLLASARAVRGGCSALI